MTVARVCVCVQVDFSKLMSGMQREYMVDAADRQWWEGSGLGEVRVVVWWQAVASVRRSHGITCACLRARA